MPQPPKKKATIQDVYDLLVQRGDIIVPPIDPPPCTCPEWCAGKASGTMAYCEEGIWRPIDPPTQNSTLRFNASSGLPYWDPD